MRMNLEHSKISDRLKKLKTSSTAGLTLTCSAANFAPVAALSGNHSGNYITKIGVVSFAVTLATTTITLRLKRYDLRPIAIGTLSL